MKGRISFFSVAAFVALMAGAGNGDARTGQCVATFDPDTVLSGSQAEVVSYALSEPIGAVSQVTPAEGSGIQVAAVDTTASTVTFDTRAAVTGAWDVTFQGSEQSVCVGSLNVKGVDR